MSNLETVPIIKFEQDFEVQTLAEVTPAVQSSGKCVELFFFVHNLSQPFFFKLGHSIYTPLFTQTFPHPHLSDVTMEKPCVLAEPADNDSESDRFAESPDGETCHHRSKVVERENFQDAQKLPGGTQKALPVKSSSSEPLSAAAAGHPKGQNQLKHSQKVKHVPKHFPGPEELSASRTFFKTGRRLCRLFLHFVF